MKELIFWMLYILTVIIIVYRFNKAFLYFNAKFKKKNTENLLQAVSVVLPLGEYNERIEENIIKNIKKLHKSNFIFSIDLNRKDIIKQVEQLMKSIEFYNFEIVETDFGAPFGKKMEGVLENSKEYVIILNPYIKIVGNISEILEELSMHDFIVNGLVYGNSQGNQLEKLYNSFCNNHSFFDNLASAEVMQYKRINSKFWCVKKENIEKILDKFIYENLDEFEGAEAVIGNNIDIFQSRVVGEYNAKVDSMADFTDKVGEEVEVFFNSVKNTLSLRAHSLTIWPVFLPGVTFIYSIFLGPSYLILVVISLLLKAVDSYMIRRFMLDKSLKYTEILGEVIIDISGIILIFFRKSS